MEGRTIDVTVLSALELKKLNHFGDQKCYAVAYIYPVMKQSTVADSHGGVNPIWDSTLSFVCYEAHLHPPNSDSYAITVEIFCQGNFMGKDKLVGMATLPLGDLVVRHGNPKDELKPVDAKLPVLRHSGEAQGTLNLSVQVGSKRILEPHEDPFAARQKPSGSGSSHQHAPSSSGSSSSPPVPSGQFSSSPSPGSLTSPEFSKYSKTPEGYPSDHTQTKPSASSPGASSSGASSSGAKDSESRQLDNDVVTGYPMQNYPAPYPPGQPQMQQQQYMPFDPLGQARMPQQQRMPAYDPLSQAQPMVMASRRDMKKARRRARRDGVPDEYPRRRRRGGPLMLLVGLPIHIGVAVVGAAVRKVHNHEARRDTHE